MFAHLFALITLTTQSMPSLSPSPVSAEHLKMAHCLSLIWVSPRYSEIWGEGGKGRRVARRGEGVLRGYDDSWSKNVARIKNKVGEELLREMKVWEKEGG